MQIRKRFKRNQNNSKRFDTYPHPRANAIKKDSTFNITADKLHLTYCSAFFLTLKYNINEYDIIFSSFLIFIVFPYIRNMLKVCRKKKRLNY